MRMRFLMVATTAALALGACGDSEPSATVPATTNGAAAAPEAVEAVEAVAPAGPPATREEVIDALTCHSLISQAMAHDILGGDASAAAGVRNQTRWRVEADRRAKAAGLSEDEFAAIQTQARAPIVTRAEWEANQPKVADCIARTPGR